MIVVKQRKVGQAAVIALGLILVSGLAGCSRSSDTQADSRPAEPAAESAPVAPATDAPLGESTRSASVEASPAPTGAPIVQTAEAAPPSVVKAATVETAADDADKAAPSLSAEQQELAAEVGDTRHASAAVSDKGADKAPD